jgi:hypothetical protein
LELAHQRVSLLLAVIFFLLIFGWKTHQAILHWLDTVRAVAKILLPLAWTYDEQEAEDGHVDVTL